MEKHSTELKTVMKILEKIEKEVFHKHYKEIGIDTYASFVHNDFQWACDDCLQSKKAILAASGAKFYYSNPSLAYYDIPKVCKKCGVDFIFSKTEKKLWYDTLGFVLDSSPNNCKECRREIRHLKRENSILSGILKKEELEITGDELNTIIEIYTNWDKAEKVKYYQALLRKRMKKVV